MKSALPLLVFVLLAGCSSSAPQYSKDVTRDAGAIAIRLNSITDMSADAMRGALYTEAARATIEDGAVYLRVDELSTDSSIGVKESAPGVAPDPVPNRKSASIALSKRRSGVVRFHEFRERPASGEVYSATDLLDRIRGGSIP